MQIGFCHLVPALLSDSAHLSKVPQIIISLLNIFDFTRILFFKIVKAPWIKVAAMADNDTYIVPGKIHTV